MILRDVTLAQGLANSSSVKSITLNVEVNALNDTAMGDTTESNAAGLLKWSGSITYFQDYTDDGVDEDCYALIGTTATFSAKPTSASASASNPRYNGTALFTSVNPIDGTVGDLAEITLNFVSAGALSRSTSD
jgi:hypothetical protein